MRAIILVPTFLMASAYAAPTGNGLNLSLSGRDSEALQPRQGDYMAVVNWWRSQNGLAGFAHSGQLEGNARNAVESANGQIVYKLNPGTQAQIMGHAGQAGFQDVFNRWIGDGNREVLAGGWGSIGCAWYLDVWACDFA